MKKIESSEDKILKYLREKQEEASIEHERCYKRFRIFKMFYWHGYRMGVDETISQIQDNRLAKLMDMIKELEVE